MPAEATTTSPVLSLLFLALPLILIVWMFSMQRRRMRTAQAFDSSLEIGREVMTTSGIFGRVTALDESVATLEVSPGVTLRVARRALTAAPATQPPTNPAEGA